MTIKEIASFTGKDKSTIGRWIAKCNSVSINNKLQNATQYDPADFTIDEVGHILESGTMSKDAVSIIMENARNNYLPAERIDSVDYEVIGKMIGMAVAAALTPIVDRLDKMSSQQHLQIESPKEDYYSLVAYCSIHRIKSNRSELALHGRELRNMTLSKGLVLKKIPDERYGFVNSYPVEILDEYFRV